MRGLVAIFSAVGCLLLICSGSLLAEDLGSTAPAEQRLEAAEFSPQLGARVPYQIELIDHDGKQASLAELVAGKPTVLCLVYFRCPMLCELTADGMVRGLSELKRSVGDDFNVLMVSFDPSDTAQRAAAAREIALKRYSRPGAEAGWFVMTGKDEAIERLTDAVGFRYYWDKQSRQFAHPAGLVVLTRDGVISSYLDGVRFQPKELAAAIEGATEGEVSQQAPSSFLRCYLYDPTTGRFGYAVLWALRIGGILTVCGMVVGVTALSMRKAGPSAGE